MHTKRLAWVVLVALTLIACSGGSSPCMGACADHTSVDGAANDGTANDGTTNDTALADATSDLGDTAPTHGIVRLAIDPPTATITSVNGSAATQQFTLYGVMADGSRAPISGGSWTADNAPLGAISAMGLYSANGGAGGVVQITAHAMGAGGTPLMATASLTIQVRQIILGPGVTGDPSTHFGTLTADPANEAHLLYPLDGAVMPDNVAPPDVQWERGAVGDVFRVQIVKPDVTVTAYVVDADATFRYDWLVDSTAWHAVLASDVGADATITVDRWIAATMTGVSGTPIHVQIANGSIFGAVYYWAVNAGRIDRIDANGATHTTITSTTSCVACHTISRDGTLMAGTVDGTPRSLVMFDLAASVTPQPVPSLPYPFSTFGPTGRWLLLSGYGGDTGEGGTSDGFVVLDLTSNMTVAPNGLTTDHHVTHPDWSPASTTGSAPESVAFIGNISGSTSGSTAHYTNGDLFTMTVDETTTPITFGTPQMIHSGSALASQPEGGSSDGRPSWSPDGRLLAFSHGPVPYSQFQSASALYLIPPGGGTPVRLDAANGGANGTSAFWPTFSPFITSGTAGRMYWLAFYSQRDYGNAQAGTRGTMRRQLWVSAIQPSATGDPSSVPYWLPGQDATTDNGGARWAPSPCRANGSGCASGDECCSGLCMPDPTMPSHLICQPPPMNQCRQEGQGCGSNSDCCSGLSCTANVCIVPPG